MDVVHHIVHFIGYSLILWQIILGIWIILKWVSKNFKFHRSPVLNIGESFQRSGSSGEETKVKKNLGPVEVDIKKQITIVDADVSDLKSDEVKKGKVKTQKDKLRSLRR
jgi:hypothetical protein